MSEKYTPTTDELRRWVTGPEFAGGVANEELGARFDRAIAKIRADAVREAVKHAKPRIDRVEYEPHLFGAGVGLTVVEQYADKIEEDAG